MKIHVKRVRVGTTEMLSFLVCVATILDISYLNIIIGNMSQFKMFYFIFVLFIELVVGIGDGIKVRSQHMMLLIAGCLVVVSTALHKGSMFSCLSDLGAVVIVSFLLLIYCKKEQLIRVLKVWCSVFFLLLLIDTFTMIAWPNGLYTSNFYRYNWFLGYKTSRLAYTFTLLVLYNYYEMIAKKAITWHSGVLAIMVSFNAFMSKSTGATLAVIAYSVILFFLFGQKITLIGQWFQKCTQMLVRHHFWIFIVWFLSYMLIVIFYDTPIVQSIIGNMDKDYSFGQRVMGWQNALITIKKNWLIGMGIQSRESTMQITGGLANAHNTMFTYLLTGGVIGLLLLLCVVFSALRRTSIHKANYMVTIYIYCILFLGIISSAMAFCPYFFAILILPFTAKIQLENEKQVQHVIN